MVKATLPRELTLSSPLLILLVVGFTCPEASGEGCDLLYLKTPPSEIMCNPYSSSARLMLECEVQVLASVGNSRVEIQWFFNDTTNQAILRITDTESFPPVSAISYFRNQRIINGDVWTLFSSRITFSSLTSPTHQGIYFCQAALDGNIALFSPSNGLLVETEDEYLNFSPCSDALFKRTMKCAGNLSSSPSLTTTVPTSATPPLHTTSAAPPLRTTYATPPLHTTSAAPPLRTTSAAPPLRTTSATPLQHTVASSPSTADSSRGNLTLSLWAYVLVVIAAVFGMIIVVLTILCVVLYLKNKTTDSLKKHALNDSTNITMVQDETYGLFKDNPSEADGNLTANDAYGVAQEPENNSSNFTMVQNGLSIENQPDADDNITTNEAYGIVPKPENSTNIKVFQNEAYGLSIEKPPDGNMAINDAYGVVLEPENDTNITMVQNETYGLTVDNLPEVNGNITSNKVYRVAQDLEPDYQEIP